MKCCFENIVVGDVFYVGAHPKYGWRRTKDEMSYLVGYRVTVIEKTSRYFPVCWFRMLDEDWEMRRGLLSQTYHMKCEELPRYVRRIVKNV